MTNYNGFGTASWDKYEDHQSLKKYINSGLGQYWESANTIYFNQNTLSTGSKVACESFENGAIANIGKTELTLVGACSADDNAYIGMVVTLVYKSNDGVSHYATCSLAADSSAEADFVYACTANGLNHSHDADGTAIEDYYCTVSATSSVALNAAESFSAGATGALGSVNHGFEIAAETTDATVATIGGVGNVYSRSHTEHDNADETVQYLDYMTPWGQVRKNAVSTLTTTSVDEIRFILPSGEYVSDFWQPISFMTDTATTSDTNERLLTDAACSNVDGSGSDVYGCIDEGMTSAKFSGMRAGEDGVTDTWLVGIHAHGFIETALGDMYIVTINLTPKGETYEKEIVMQFQDILEHEFCIELEPDTEVTISIQDIDAAGHVTVESTYIVAKRM